MAVNWARHGNGISDSVTSSTFFVALYLGITGFAGACHHRLRLTRSALSLRKLGIMLLLSGLLLFGLLDGNVYLAAEPDYSYVTWSMPFFRHRDVGGVLLSGITTTAAGPVFVLATRVTSPSLFRGETMRERVSITADGPVVRFEEGPEPE